MCGITGILSEAIDARACRESLDRLAHRGPDGEGELKLGSLWLGQRRLAIIDLTPAAAQPMTIEGCGTIVFNGEIYNHEDLRRRFSLPCTSRSDTEVLLRGLAARGVSFLREIQGMYAFAWLDASGARMTLARDHAGMKPLWVWTGRNALAFSSEIRSLVPLIRSAGGQVRPSLPAIRAFLRFGSVQEPSAFLSGVEAVGPDEVWTADVTSRAVVSRSRVERWVEGDVVHPADAVARTVEAVRAAVDRHLVSDRPVALFLSSGLDSSILANEVARARGRAALRAVTVRLESAGTADEPQLVRDLASRLGLDLDEVAVSDLSPLLDHALEAYDQPSIDGLNTFLIASVARKLGLAVALSGVGADEVFGGYRHLRSPSRSSAERLAAGFLGAGSRALLRSRNSRVRRLALLLDGARMGEPRTRSFRRLLAESEITRIMGNGYASPDPRNVIDDPLSLEQATYLRDTLLRDTDVMGMASGVEIRAPFLDPEVMSVARSIGTAQVLRPDRPAKWLLREGWKDDLELLALTRPKSGFTLNLAGTLAGRAAWVRDLVESLSSRPWVNRQAIRALVSRWQSGDPQHAGTWARTLLLLQLELHLRRWGDP